MVRVDLAGFKPGVARQTCDGVATLCSESWSPRARIDGVLLVGPLLDFLEERRQAELLQVGGQLLVVPGRGRVRGKVVQERQVVALAEDEALKVEGAGDQDQRR